MSQSASTHSQQGNTARKRSGAGWLQVILLALIVLLGGYLRFTGLNWDDFVGLHPDERFLTRNLLPIVGGRLEFTDDPDFPKQTLITAASNTAYVSQIDIEVDTTSVVGALEDSPGADFARRKYGADRVRTFGDPEALLRGALTEEIDAALMDESLANMFGNSDTRALGTYTSQDLQRARCEALNPETDGAGGYFDTYCSPLNPHNAGNGFYTYGTLPLFMAHFASEFVQAQDAAGSPIFDWQGHTLIWRFLSAFFDCGTIILIFLIGRRMHNGWVGLIAALLYAAAPLPVQKAHFGTVNAITGFVVTLGLWAALGVQDRGRLIYFIIFGVALGSAVASRINTAPLAGVVVLAAMVHGAAAFNSRLPNDVRMSLATRMVIGVLIAAFTSMLTFRIFNPYAFDGPGFFGLHLHDRWLADISAGSYGVSGYSDAPPNWQWLARASYFYPLRDMLLYGMGIAFGMTAVAGFLWAGWRIVRAKTAALRNLLPFTWTLVYFAWMGGLWVMTMRYYLPLYSSLAVLAAWLLYELWQRSRQQDVPFARLMLGAFVLVFGAIPAYYAAQGQAQTATSLFALGIAVILLVVALFPRARRTRAGVLMAFVMGFTVLWGVMYTDIYRNLSPRVEASRWLWENIPGDFALQIDDAPADTPLVNFAIYNTRPETTDTPEKLAQAPSVLDVGAPYFQDFVAPASGTISSVIAPHLGDPLDDDDEETLFISLARRNGDETVTLAEVEFSANFTRDVHPLGSSYTIALPEPVAVEAGETYVFKAEALSGPISTSGAVVVADEAGWDDPLTAVKICRLPAEISLKDDIAPGFVHHDDCQGLDAWTALVQSHKMSMSFPIDEPLKRDFIQDGLDLGDYVVFTSNRFYDTVTRNRMRLPLSSAFYDAIFAGELGYELVEVFHGQYQLGPLSVSDQHLPIYDSPAWLNELEADEAFHVYDHPVVFVFQKTGDYDPYHTARVLYDVPLQRMDRLGSQIGDVGAQIANVINWSSIEADRAPTGLNMPEDVAEINTSGGTWSERFNTDSLLNQNQALGAAVWWLAIVAYGIISFPMLFVAFRGMSDRGYGVAKFVGLLVIAWAAWLMGHLRFATWSQAGIITLLAALALFNLVVAYRNRSALLEYARQHWQRIAVIELLSLVLFVAWIAVRLSNPDLWHFSKGGEKPMDFAYLNGVLRSTVFPPLDPWHAGGYINYYYFGFVLVGSPVLLLQIVPSFAYNLIIPTLYAITGSGAFSAAFNIVAGWRRTDDVLATETHPRRAGSPWLAGLMGVILCIGVGNLDTARVFLRGVADLGGYRQPQGISEELRTDYYEQYATDNEFGEIVLPPERTAELQTRIENINVFDNIGYELRVIQHTAGSVINGFGELLQGTPLRVYSDRWYWGPSRVLAETPGVEGGAITEMPMFTFVYGDLHAHMINLPVLLFVILFVFNEVKSAREDRRGIFGLTLALFFGALSVGLIQAINTWDYPAFLLFAVVGLGYAWWLRWEQISRWSLLYLLFYVGGFMILAAATAIPHQSYYAATYGSIDLWQGGKTPIWAYLDIYGLFLFIIVGLLLWDTARWWRGVKVKALRGRSRLFTSLMLGAVFISAGVLMATLAGYQVALIVVPLVLWIVPLFFRKGQTVEMQFVLVLIGLALMMTLGVEIIVVAGDIQRQNTVFKFYMQAWVLLGVACGAAAAWLIRSSDNWGCLPNALLYAPLMLLLALAGLYPVMAIPARAQDRMTPPPPQTHQIVDGDTLEEIAHTYAKSVKDILQLNEMQPDDDLTAGETLVITPDYTDTQIASSLNGIEYMQYAGHRLHYSGVPVELQDDYEIIRWLQENVSGTPVIIEGREPASEYTWTARISINTGLPSVLGWNFHQRQQRTFDPLPQMVQQREENVKWFYSAADIVGSVDILRFYDVRYIIVSGLERANSTRQGLAKIEQLAELGLTELVFESGSGQIYAVNVAAMDEFAQEQLAFELAASESYAPTPSPRQNNSPDMVFDLETSTDIATREAVTVLQQYDVPHVVIDNVGVMQAESPQMARVVNRLAAENVLTSSDVYRDQEGRPQRVIYRVDAQRLNEYAAEIQE